MSDDPQPSPPASAGRWDEGLPFLLGDSGPGVSDLQHRLARLGYWTGGDRLGEYRDGTARAVRSFQRDRGLRADGLCGRHTWSSVVEAGFRLGDRLLYRRSPMLHGDDIAELQRQLSALGFDPGGVDGIFGDQTGSALADFQHNIGISSDGICGPRTLAELSQLKLRRGAEDLVSSVREQLEVSNKVGTLQARVIAVGEPGGFQAGAVALSRALVAVGARAVTIHHPDESEQAEAANIAGADCYIGLRLDPELAGVRTIYYRGYRYESETSKQLARLVSDAVAKALDLRDEGSEGMALPVLRETRMPAVIVELGRPAVVAMHSSRLAVAIIDALASWLGKEWT
ncbi:MAG: N-acetylmuramoyl-L-alanine amidase [Acidimicrobiales bacterium]